MTKLEIRIFGEVGAGKTTVMRYIRNTLEKAGISISLENTGNRYIESATIRLIDNDIDFLNRISRILESTNAKNI